MGKIFDLESPVMRALSKMADVFWLNILTLVCCIPIVTAGSAFTALHFCCLKLVRNEEGYITKDFFRSFKENFKQATIIRIIVLIINFVFLLDFLIMFNPEMFLIINNPFYMPDKEPVSSGLAIAIGITALLYIFTLLYVYPLQSHFYNPIKKTIKNAFLLSIMSLPKTILMLAAYLVPWVIIYFVPRLEIVCVLFLVSAPSYVSALLYDKIFAKFEPEKKEENDDLTWTVGGEEEDGESAEEIEEVEEQKMESSESEDV